MNGSSLSGILLNKIVCAYLLFPAVATLLSSLQLSTPLLQSWQNCTDRHSLWRGLLRWFHTATPRDRHSPAVQLYSSCGFIHWLLTLTSVEGKTKTNQWYLSCKYNIINVAKYKVILYSGSYLICNICWQSLNI